jgi:hypothetical protein
MTIAEALPLAARERGPAGIRKDDVISVLVLICPGARQQHKAAHTGVGR